MEVAGTVAAMLAALITTPNVKKPQKECPQCGIANRSEFYRCRKCGYLFFD